MTVRRAVAYAAVAYVAVCGLALRAAGILDRIDRNRP